MKVLFAVNNENISTQIVKRYQKEYKEIISYKNMYYFNAIIKELQRDKSYDRVVISEELEPFANNNIDSIEKFIFEKLDSISDEATGINGKDIPIIVLAADKRKKSDPILVKLFGIGIYDVLLGQDRTTDNVCSLLNKPRSKKEAKAYYKIESDEVNYKSESETNVSETEIKNILNYYRRLGKNEDLYVESFNNIAAQYNDAQLRIITRFLPLNVKAVLEEKSPKYQSVMTFDVESTSSLMEKKEEEQGLKVGFLNYSNVNKPTRPVIVPTAVKKVATKKISNPSRETESIIKKDVNNTMQTKGPELRQKDSDDLLLKFEETDVNIEESPSITEKNEEPIKKGRGRPRKIVQNDELAIENMPKRGRGRPKKIVAKVQDSNLEIADDIKIEGNNNNLEDTLPSSKFIEEAEDALPGFDETEEAEDALPGFDEIEETEDTLPGFGEIEETEDTLPGFDEIEETEDTLPGFDEIEETEDTLPGFGEIEETEDAEDTLPGFDDIEEVRGETIDSTSEIRTSALSNFGEYNNEQRTFNLDNNISNLLLKDKKIVSFVGTTKNGTSFLINNIAKTLASGGIKTAILDLTSNRNSYYIYTKNEEKLRNIAYESIKKLAKGENAGITVNNFLDVFTAVPRDNVPIEYAKEILSTLAKKYSVILIDSDFDTPIEYFKLVQEIYIIQTMDILTIQPMTAFLRDLKAKDVLSDEKIRIIINKYINVRGLTTRTIIGGLAFYNDPSMSFMTELFNKDKAKYWTVPFDLEACTNYLEGVMDCEIRINSYPKKFNEKLREIANVVYPLIGGSKRLKDSHSTYNKFSPNMNNTLEQMKNKY